MRCRACGGTFDLARVREGMGEPDAPGTILAGSLAISVVGLLTALAAWLVGWECVFAVGCVASGALFLAAMYLPDSVRFYRECPAGRCPACGADNRVRWWSS